MSDRRFGGHTWTMWFALLFTLSFFVNGGFSQANEDAAIEAIAKAEDDLAFAFKAVLDTETVGGNVFDFMLRFDEVGKLLADAKMLFRKEDFDGATLSAQMTSESSKGLRNDAVERARTAGIELGQKLFWTVASSTFGVFFVVFAGFFGWRYVSRSIQKTWRKRLLTMKPEVHEDNER